MNGPASPLLVDTGAVWEETPHLSVCFRGGASSNLGVQDFLRVVLRTCPSRLGECGDSLRPR